MRYLKFSIACVLIVAAILYAFFSFVFMDISWILIDGMEGGLCRGFYAVFLFIMCLFLINYIME